MADVLLVAAENLVVAVLHAAVGHLSVVGLLQVVAVLIPEVLTVGAALLAGALFGLAE